MFPGVAGAIALAVIAWLVIEGVLDDATEDTTPTVMEDEAAG